MNQPQVILGMSGGVDSSVAAALLVEQGYKVHGITLEVWEPEDEHAAVSKRWQERGCCKVGLARFVAQRLGMSHEVINMRDTFRAHVIDDFVAGYLGGTTPNPCVRCNERVKLRALVQLAEQRGVGLVATGHYARIVRDGSRLFLNRSADLRKDQSYFLYRMNPAWLPRLLFPVGNMQKTEVWTRAEALGLPTEELKESQEICFVSQGDYRMFLETEVPDANRPGFFTDDQGHVLGQHRGIAYYTPGQRRGLGIAATQRFYVHRVEPATQTVVVGPEEGLFRSDCRVTDLNLFEETLSSDPRRVDIKIRYATPAAAGVLNPTANGALQIAFDVPQRALSPGQSAVFYEGERVLGGGIIQPN